MITPDSTLKRALDALKEVRARLESVERGRREPIAIIGLGCRLPGAVDSPASYWRLLSEGGEGICEVPPDRWPVEAFHSDSGDRPGTMRFRRAGFIDNVDEFDAPFFEISPREAAHMDPQQRLMLQVAWEALEDAGIDVTTLRGSATGVWAAVNSNDYFQLQTRDTRFIDTHTVVGGAGSIVANRLSYMLDLHGPSMAVDTACSSGLVAVHLACQSLRSGESDLAISGAVNLILSPYSTLAHMRGLPIAADARCKTFDARADGYVRGEGCGVLVLKRFGDALRDGDAIWALIRGSAINQDGRTNGLTAPSGLSQQRVIQQALANSGVEAGSVSFIETHGTGTALGDPIEVEALQAVYGRGPSRCALGSVKTNIGHLESAAGIAGIMKVALSLHHRNIPANLNFERLNPHIELDHPRFSIPTTLTPWTTAKRFAAVSSFGAGGTNAHVVLEQAPGQTDQDGADEAQRAAPACERIVVLSARTEPALRAAAARLHDWLELHPDTRLDDIAFTAGRRRPRLDVQLAAVVRDGAELRRQLAVVAAGEPGPPLLRTSSGRSKVVFVFPGQGSQWPGMGRDLLRTEPAFRSQLEACAAAIESHSGWSPMAALQAGESITAIDELQPTLWAISCALAALWRAWGVEPDAVVGHSMGEVAAAAVSGALSLDHAAQVICRRSRLLRRASGQGAMILAALGLADAEAVVQPWSEQVSVAVSNSPLSTVMSGSIAGIEAVEAELRRRNVFCRRVRVDVASHSPQMDPLHDDLLATLASVEPRQPMIEMRSTVHGGRDPRLTAEYWVRNLREPVRFADVTRGLLDDGYHLFIECSAHPLLCEAIEQTAEQRAGGTRSPTAHSVLLTLPSMRRDESDVAVMRESWAACLCAGVKLDPGDRMPRHGQVLRLPTYPWQQRSYWFCSDHLAALAAVGSVSADGEAADAVAPTSAPAMTATMNIEHLPRHARRERIEDHLAAEVTEILRYGDTLDRNAGFFALGMDSMMAAELRRRLTIELGCPLASSAIFEHPTVVRLSDYLATLLGADAPDVPSVPDGGADSNDDAAELDELLVDAAEMSEQELLAALAEELATELDQARDLT
jgi:acyl transferase domain-containing protein